MTNSPSSPLLDRLSTLSTDVEDVALALRESTVDSSLVAHVRQTLFGLSDVLWSLTVLLVRRSSSWSDPFSGETSTPQGGTGAPAPMQTHKVISRNPLTGAVKCDATPLFKPPSEPPAEWSQDSDDAFEALDDEDVPPDYEDGICGP